MLSKLHNDERTSAKINSIFKMYAGDYLGQKQFIENTVKGMQKAAQFSISLT